MIQRDKHHKIQYLFLFATIVMFLIIVACRANEPRDALSVGNSAPDFTLQNGSGGQVSLADYKEKQAVLLYFSMADG